MSWNLTEGQDTSSRVGKGQGRQDGGEKVCKEFGMCSECSEKPLGD